MHFWHSLMRALGKHDVFLSDAIPPDIGETIRSLRSQRWSADQQTKLLRDIDKRPNPADALRRARQQRLIP